MTKRQNRQIEMLVRVRDFGKAHTDRFPDGGDAHRAFTTVDSALAEIKSFLKDRHTAKRLAKREKDQAKRAVLERIRMVAKTAQVMARTIPDADARFPSPKRRGDQPVLQMGTIFLEEATVVKDAFIRAGMRPTFVEDLQKAVDGFERAIANCEAGRSEALVAREAIDRALQRGLDAARALNVVALNALEGDELAIKEWTNCRRIDFEGRRTAIGSVEPQSNPVEPPVASSDPEPLRKAS